MNSSSLPIFIERPLRQLATTQWPLGKPYPGSVLAYAA